MAAILERGIDTARGDAIAASAAAMGEVPALREFVVKVKRGREVRLTQCVTGTDSVTVAADHEHLKESGEHITVQCRCFGFSEEELLAADVSRATNKSQRAHALNDAAALDLQVQNLRCLGGL